MAKQALTVAPGSRRRQVVEAAAEVLAPRLWRLVLLAPGVALLLIVFAVPVLRLLLLSVAGHPLSLEPYARLMGSGVVVRVFAVTVGLTLITTVITLVLGFSLAYVLASLPTRLAAVLAVFVLIPFWTTTVVTTFAFFILLGRSGLVNNVLVGTGMAPKPLPLLFNAFSVVAGLVHIALPLMVLSVYAAIRQIDRSLLLAAASLGASPGRALREVLLPLSMPGIAAGCTLVFVTTVGAFVIPALLGSNTENMVAQFIYAQVEQLNDLPAASALTVGLLVVTAVALLVLSRFVGLSRIWDITTRVA